MRVIFWNVQRSGLDEGGWLDEGLADLIHRTPTPEAIVLCELSEGYTGGQLAYSVRAWNWEAVPLSPAGTGGNYLKDTSLRLAAIQPQHGLFTQTLVGRGVGQSRPSLMLTRHGGGAAEHIAFVHLPAQMGGFTAAVPVAALNEIAQGLTADGHHVGPAGPYDVSAVVGDLNVNAGNPADLAAFTLALNATAFQNFVRARPFRRTHTSGSELDWALVAPGVPGPSVDRLDWSRAKPHPDDDFVPGSSAKRSDHWPILLTW